MGTPYTNYVPPRIPLDFLPKICDKSNEIGLSMIDWWIQLIINKIIVKSYIYLGHIYVTQGAELCFPSAICADQPFDYLTNRPLNYLTGEYLA
jgi:hypothetical protein